MGRLRDWSDDFIIACLVQMRRTWPPLGHHGAAPLWSPNALRSHRVQPVESEIVLQGPRLRYLLPAPLPPWSGQGRSRIHVNSDPRTIPSRKFEPGRGRIGSADCEVNRPDVLPALSADRHARQACRRVLIRERGLLPGPVFSPRPGRPRGCVRGSEARHGEHSHDPGPDIKLEGQ